MQHPVTSQLCTIHLAGNGAHARSLVGTAVVVGLARGAVDVQHDAGVGLRVGTGDRLRGTGGEAAGSRDGNLSAAGVELDAARAVGAVQSGQLHAEEVLSWGDALRNVEVGPAGVLEDVVNTPAAGASVEGILGNLKPAEVGVRRGGSVVHACKPGGDGTLVGGRDRVVGVVGALGSADDVLVKSANASTRGDGDDVAVPATGRTAGEVARARGLHWVVVVGGSDTPQETLSGTVDGELL